MANGVEVRIREANEVLEECRQRAIDPVEALRRAIQVHDKEQGYDLPSVQQTVPR